MKMIKNENIYNIIIDGEKKEEIKKELLKYWEDEKGNIIIDDGIYNFFESQYGWDYFSLVLRDNIEDYIEVI